MTPIFPPNPLGDDAATLLKMRATADQAAQRGSEQQSLMNERDDVRGNRKVVAWLERHAKARRGMRLLTSFPAVAVGLVVASCGGVVRGADEDTDASPRAIPYAGAGGAPASVPHAGAGSASASMGPTYNGISEHPGCDVHPCCLGGSSDTRMELPSKCKYLVKALFLCGCYEPTDLDDAVRGCIDAYTKQGEGCSGMNCGSLEACSSARIYFAEIAVSMPPVAVACDRSDRRIMEAVYANSCP